MFNLVNCGALCEHASWEWGFNTAPRWHVCYSQDFSLRFTVRLCGESIVRLYSVACIFSLVLPFNQNILLTIWILLLGLLALAHSCWTCFCTELPCFELSICSFKIHWVQLKIRVQSVVTLTVLLGVDVWCVRISLKV